eukprot:CAMPEP_0197438354 /NCGR_PEP_ID=MMETSP1175-20131217/5383_1 /TAXON_ID=1003142 /ORGANISM="Triceratium dubium, Strain CCMP147" /LENGTH=223 /DNA_ID=CAMNT_0042968067 /DNA_START=232 /DNA_END=902 /DNA_ORIENTATION=+
MSLYFCTAALYFLGDLPTPQFSSAAAAGAVSGEDIPLAAWAGPITWADLWLRAGLEGVYRVLGLGGTTAASVAGGEDRVVARGTAPITGANAPSPAPVTATTAVATTVASSTAATFATASLASGLGSSTTARVAAGEDVVAALGQVQSPGRAPPPPVGACLKSSGLGVPHLHAEREAQTLSLQEGHTQSPGLTGMMAVSSSSSLLSGLLRGGELRGVTRAGWA